MDVRLLSVFCVTVVRVGACAVLGSWRGGGGKMGTPAPRLTAASVCRLHGRTTRLSETQHAGSQPASCAYAPPIGEIHDLPKVLPSGPLSLPLGSVPSSSLIHTLATSYI